MEDEYSKKIKVKTLWRAIRYHCVLFLIMAIAFGAVPAAVCYFATPREYQSSVKIESTSSNTFVYLNNLVELAKDQTIHEKAADVLKQKEIGHPGGAEITSAEIKNGIVAPYVRENGFFVRVYYNTVDSDTAVFVLDELATQIIKEARVRYGSYYDKFSVQAPPSTPAKVSQEVKASSALAILGLAVSYFVCLCLELVQDKIRNQSDIPDFVSVYEGTGVIKNKSAITVLDIKGAIGEAGNQPLLIVGCQTLLRGGGYVELCASNITNIVLLIDSDSMERKEMTIAEFTNRIAEESFAGKVFSCGVDSAAAISQNAPTVAPHIFITVRKGATTMSRLWRSLRSLKLLPAPSVILF